MTSYAYGQSTHSKLRAAHHEKQQLQAHNQQLRDALHAATTDRNKWRDLFYTTQAQAERVAANRHGKTTGYRDGCRCQPCRDANTRANQRAYQKRKQNQP